MSPKSDPSKQTQGIIFSKKSKKIYLLRYVLKAALSDKPHISKHIGTFLDTL